MIGSNFRMTELQAALGIAQCINIKKHINERVELAEYLTDIVKDLPGIIPPKVRDKCSHVYYCWGFKIKKNILGISRKRFSDALLAEGFPHSIGYIKPLYLLPIFQKKIAMGENGFPFNLNPKIEYLKGMCPIVEKLYEEEFLFFEPCAYKIDTKEKPLLRDAFIKVYENLGALKKIA